MVGVRFKRQVVSADLSQGAILFTSSYRQCILPEETLRLPALQWENEGAVITSMPFPFQPAGHFKFICSWRYLESHRDKEGRVDADSNCNGHFSALVICISGK